MHGLTVPELVSIFLAVLILWSIFGRPRNNGFRH